MYVLFSPAVHPCSNSLPQFIHDLLAKGELADAKKRMSEWYGDDPRRFLPQRPFYAGWDEKERIIVADRKEDVTLLISDARDWEEKHG